MNILNRYFYVYCKSKAANLVGVGNNPEIKIKNFPEFPESRRCVASHGFQKQSIGGPNFREPLFDELLSSFSPPSSELLLLSQQKSERVQRAIGTTLRRTSTGTHSAWPTMVWILRRPSTAYRVPRTATGLYAGRLNAGVYTWSGMVV